MCDNSCVSFDFHEGREPRKVFLLMFASNDDSYLLCQFSFALHFNTLRD